MQNQRTIQQEQGWKFLFTSSTHVGLPAISRGLVTRAKLLARFESCSGVAQSDQEQRVVCRSSGRGQEQEETHRQGLETSCQESRNVGAFGRIVISPAGVGRHGVRSKDGTDIRVVEEEGNSSQRSRAIEMGRLTALSKCDSGVRGVVQGDVVWRLVAHVAILA